MSEERDDLLLFQINTSELFFTEINQYHREI